MKRFVCLVCCWMLLALCLTGAVAEETEIITDPAMLEGVWQCFADNDSLPYLDIHADGTLEAYDWWKMGMRGENGALLMFGEYTFDAATGALTLPNGRVYTARTAVTSEEQSTTDGNSVALVGSRMLFLQDESDPEADLAYVQSPDGIGLLPTEEDLADEDIVWYPTDSPKGEQKAETYVFHVDGSVEVGEGDATREGTYAMTGGLLTLTVDDQTRQMYLQYVTEPIEELSEEEAELYADEIYDGWTVHVNPYSIEVCELNADGSLSHYWLGSIAG